MRAWSSLVPSWFRTAMRRFSSASKSRRSGSAASTACSAARVVARDLRALWQSHSACQPPLCCSHQAQKFSAGVAKCRPWSTTVEPYTISALKRALGRCQLPRNAQCATKCPQHTLRLSKLTSLGLAEDAQRGSQSCTSCSTCRIWQLAGMSLIWCAARARSSVVLPVPAQCKAQIRNPMKTSLQCQRPKNTIREDHMNRAWQL